MKSLDCVFSVKKSYNASGSNHEIIGTIFTGSNLLTVNEIADFQIEHGICVTGAGENNSNLITKIIAINGLEITLQESALNTVNNVNVKHDDTFSIQHAIVASAHLGGSVVCFPAGSYQVSKDITFPSTITLEFSNGANLMPASDITLNISAVIKAGCYQIFDGEGTVLINNLATKVYPQWWGATGDGVNDDTAAISNALNSMAEQMTLSFPTGNYKIKPLAQGSTFELKKGQKIIGDGQQSTNIVCDCSPITPQGQSLFAISSSNCAITDLSINGGGLSTIQNMILGKSGHKNLILKNININNVGTNLAAVLLYDGSYDLVSNVQISAFVGDISEPILKSHGLYIENSKKSPTYHKIENIAIFGGYFGITLKNQQYVVASNLQIIDHLSKVGDSGDGINFNNSDNCTITNATIFGRSDGGLVVYSDVTNEVPENNVFSSIVSSNNIYEGVYLSAGKNNMFSNIICINNNQAKIEGRHGVYVNDDSGIKTESNLFNGLISIDTQEEKTQIYGIAVAKGAESNKFLNCILSGKDGDYSDNGMNTLITKADAFLLNSHYGYVIPNGRDSSAAYYGTNDLGEPKRLLTIFNTGELADATTLLSAGGGIEFLSSGSEPLGYITNDGQWYIKVDGNLEPISTCEIELNGKVYRVLSVPNS